MTAAAGLKDGSPGYVVLHCNVTGQTLLIILLDIVDDTCTGCSIVRLANLRNYAPCLETQDIAGGRTPRTHICMAQEALAFSHRWPTPLAGLPAGWLINLCALYAQQP